MCESDTCGGSFARRRITSASRSGCWGASGVSADSTVASLVERGLIAEGGRDDEAGAIRYRTTPLFERVFGLESLAALPRLEDLGADVTEIRGRLEAVAEMRPA